MINNSIKYCFCFVLLLLITFDVLKAQQEQLYTQFMYNKLVFNPAYAGNEELVCMSVLYRDQWAGFAGAPKTQLISFNMPIADNRLGVGFNLVNHKIGITQKFTLEGAYAYRIPFGNGNFSLGGAASVRNYQQDFTDPRLLATQDITKDQAIDLQVFSKSIFNFGGGVYYSTNNYYLGASIPRLAQADLNFEEKLGLSQEVRHLYIMGGAAFNYTANFIFKPQMLIKFVESAPFDIDLNLGFVINKKYNLAATYRTGGNVGSIGESIDLIFGLQSSEQLLFSFAYDITLSNIRTYQNGSIELMLHYCFNKRKNQEEIINPRYF